MLNTFRNRMWSDYTPLQVHSVSNLSILEKFPVKNASNIVRNVLNSLRDISKSLETQVDVDWCLDVLKYGLVCESSYSVECVNIYCDWLSVLLPIQNPNIPKLIKNDANYMSRIMFKQIYKLFTTVNPSKPNQELEAACLNVLQTLENIGQNSVTIEPDTWEALLILLLGVTDLLLSPPGPGGHLCHSAASVLCHSWMSACSKNFPSPSLWKTFQSLATGWRHRIEMISHWSTVNLALLSTWTRHFQSKARMRASL